jgi:hypothetical protein
MTSSDNTSADGGAPQLSSVSRRLTGTSPCSFNRGTLGRPPACAAIGVLGGEGLPACRCAASAAAARPAASDASCWACRQKPRDDSVLLVCSCGHRADSNHVPG